MKEIRRETVTSSQLMCVSKRLVPPVGSATPIFYLIGEAPGAEEDRLRTPFVGHAGQTLRKALTEVGFNWDEVRIWNVSPYRTYAMLGDSDIKSNRAPNRAEVARFIDGLKGDIAVSKPKMLITLGKVAYDAVTRSPISYYAMTGKVLTWIDPVCRTLPVGVMLHPAYINYHGGVGSIYYEQYKVDFTNMLEKGKALP